MGHQLVKCQCASSYLLLTHPDIIAKLSLAVLSSLCRCVAAGFTRTYETHRAYASHLLEALLHDMELCCKCRCTASHQRSLEWCLIMAIAVPSMLGTSLRPKHSVLNLQRVPDLAVKVTLARRGSPTCGQHALCSERVHRWHGLEMLMWQ